MYEKSFDFMDKYILKAVVMNDGHQKLYIYKKENPNISNSLECIHTGINLKAEDIINKEENILNVFSNETFKIELPVSETFKAFCSWTAGIAESGLDGIKIQSQIEDLANFSVPISRFLLEFVVRDDKETALYFIQKVFDECRYENELHYQSLALNLKYIIPSIIDTPDIFLYVMKEINDIPIKYLDLIYVEDIYTIDIDFIFKVCLKCKFIPKWTSEYLKDGKNDIISDLIKCFSSFDEFVIYNEKSNWINLDEPFWISQIIKYYECTNEDVRINVSDYFIKKCFLIYDYDVSHSIIRNHSLNIYYPILYKEYLINLLEKEYLIDELLFIMYAKTFGECNLKDIHIKVIKKMMLSEKYFAECEIHLFESEYVKEKDVYLKNHIYNTSFLNSFNFYRNKNTIEILNGLIDRYNLDIDKLYALTYNIYIDKKKINQIRKMLYNNLSNIIKCNIKLSLKELFILYILKTKNIPIKQIDFPNIIGEKTGYYRKISKELSFLKFLGLINIKITNKEKYCILNKNSLFLNEKLKDKIYDIILYDLDKDLSGKSIYAVARVLQNKKCRIIHDGIVYKIEKFTSYNKPNISILGGTSYMYNHIKYNIKSKNSIYEKLYNLVEIKNVDYSQINIKP